MGSIINVLLNSWERTFCQLNCVWIWNEWIHHFKKKKERRKKLERKWKERGKEERKKEKNERTKERKDKESDNNSVCYFSVKLNEMKTKIPHT
jgi:hypothetical protein